MYREETMYKYFDNQDEPQLDEPERTKYSQNVFEMVNGIEVEFGKKKKEKDGTKTRKKRKRDKMEEEEPPVVPVPFKKQSCFFKHPYSTTFERYASSKHSQSIIHFEMLSAFSTP
jgi:hypothetical protein